MTACGGLGGVATRLDLHDFPFFCREQDIDFANRLIELPLGIVGVAMGTVLVPELTRALRLVAKADLELRSSPANKLLVLERLILALATEPTPATHATTHQFAMEL